MNLMISINLTWKLYLLPSTQEKESSKQPASQHYIFQYKMQSIVPNTFTNKESVAQEDSLNNQLKKLIYLYNLNYFKGGYSSLSHIMLNFWRVLNKLNKRIMARLRNWRMTWVDWQIGGVTGLARSCAGGISPRFFSVWKKCIRCFFAAWCHVMKQFVKLNSTISELNSNFFTTNNIHISIHLPWWDQFCLLRFARMIGSGTCWSQQKKSKTVQLETPPQPAPHWSYAN